MEWVKIEDRYRSDGLYDYKAMDQDLTPGYYIVTDGKFFGIFRHGKFKGKQYRSIFLKFTWKAGKQENHDWTHYCKTRLLAPSD